MDSWERKALHFINQTAHWDKDKQPSPLPAFSLDLLKQLMDADVVLQLELTDEPLTINGKVIQAGPVRKLLHQNGFKTIWWKDVPQESTAIQALLQHCASAVLIPVSSTTPDISVILLGWHAMQTFDDAFTACVETIRLRMKELRLQSQQQSYLRKLSQRFAAIMHTIPHALVFIDNDGFSGWVNQQGAQLLKLPGPGEQLPVILSDALTQLRNRTTNTQDIYKEAIRLFASPDNEIRNWIWQFDDPENKTCKVSCLPVNTQQISGRLWIFEE
ncbi:hypothetical protein [Chitinophaga vietnamensis]|uniref:hypothetical protein n=1 Tax=Chitinophaga vietnamensis TaxID=2593957 RepID=UPI001177BE44|nr:hypothetical protein [Chitinophaga vietnamensis]